jgi:hypothetical protein
MRKMTIVVLPVLFLHACAGTSVTPSNQAPGFASIPVTALPPLPAPSALLTSLPRIVSPPVARGETPSAASVSHSRCIQTDSFGEWCS